MSEIQDSVFGANGLRPMSERLAAALAAGAVFVCTAIYYGICLYPGVGGEINAGDSAKFQVLGHTPIMVHGPGYPLYLLLAAGLRALHLPVPGWWLIAFALSALPGALADAFAFLIVRRLTGSFAMGVAAALLLGGAHLMAIQSTEAEVYALNLLFVLAVAFLLLRFVETERLGWFLAASAVYAISFGHHLMMVMMLPIFLGLAIQHRRLVLRPRPLAWIAAFIVLGASQYLYIARVAYSPDTAYSEYMPLPPAPGALMRYILVFYFSDLYGTGLKSVHNARQLGYTLWQAQPWVSVPLIAAGAVVFAISVFDHARHRERAWRGIEIIVLGALGFTAFALWYGAWDIDAFHLPVLALALVGAVASLGLAARPSPALQRSLAAVLILAGAFGAADQGLALANREPKFAELPAEVSAIAGYAYRLTPHPVIPLSYDFRMVELYYQFLGQVPKGPDYRLSFRLPADIGSRPEISGVALPKDALQFVRKVRQQRPDMSCRTRKLGLSDRFKWPAYEFACVAAVSDAGSLGRAARPKPWP